MYLPSWLGNLLSSYTSPCIMEKVDIEFEELVGNDSLVCLAIGQTVYYYPFLAQ